MLLRDPDIEHPVREGGLEFGHPGPGRHAGRDPDDASILSRELDQFLGEDGRVVRILLRRFGHDRGWRGVVTHRLGRHGDRRRLRGPGAVVGICGRRHGHRRQRRAVEPDLVGLGGPEAAALLRPDMHDGRTGQGQSTSERLEQRVEVVARHGTDVGDPEILEQLPGLGEADDRAAQPPTEFEDRSADDRDPLDRAVVNALALAPGPRQLDLREVRRERADGRADRHLVVVEDDEHLRLALADVVERLERQAAHQRRVADHDRDPLQAVTEIARLGEPLGDRQAGPGMPAVEDVMGRLRAARETADAVELAERLEPLEAAGQELVRVRPGDRCPRRSDRAAIRAGDGARWSARRRRATTRDGRRSAPRSGGWSRGSRPPAGELGLVEAAEVGRALEVRQDRHGWRTPGGPEHGRGFRAH